MKFSSLIIALCLLAAPLRAADPPKGSLTGMGQELVVVDEKTDQAIRGALKWLASKQSGNGSWSAGGGDQHNVAMTGYVLMAFLAAGQLPDEGEYGKNVTGGVTFLLNAIKADGFIQSGTTNMYGHGIAAIALAEVYGQTKDVRIKSKVESVMRLIVNCQNNQGGWRYPPRVSDADLSVTVLQVVALRAAKNAGIEVPQGTIDRAVKYVQSCYDERSGGFTYQPNNRQPGFARTAAGIYSLQVCGLYDDPRVKTGSQYLFKRVKDDREWFTYGHFYAAPAQYMVGGETWQRWYTETRDMLLGFAEQQGEMTYWKPKYDGGRGVGELYCTAVYTTILAMPYHYVPLYQR
jgi:hypothetical protein